MSCRVRFLILAFWLNFGVKRKFFCLELTSAEELSNGLAGLTCSFFRHYVWVY